MTPTMEVNFEVYCGVCGKGVCFYTKVNGDTITVTCPDCIENIKTLKNDSRLLKGRIKELKAKIKSNKEGHAYHP